MRSEFSLNGRTLFNHILTHLGKKRNPSSIQLLLPNKLSVPTQENFEAIAGDNKPMTSSDRHFRSEWNVHRPSGYAFAFPGEGKEMTCQEASVMFRCTWLALWHSSFLALYVPLSSRDPDYAYKSSTRWVQYQYYIVYPYCIYIECLKTGRLASV